MNLSQQRLLLDHLDLVQQSSKSFDAPSEWVSINNRGAAYLEFLVALKLDGQLGGGVSLRIRTPQNAWDAEVYGQIEVSHTILASNLRIAPVEWRPRRQHRNTPQAPKILASLTLNDRYHPYEVNRQFEDIDIFLQNATGIAAPFPRAILSFNDYIEFSADIWKCADVRGIPEPPWSKELF